VVWRLPLYKKRGCCSFFMQKELNLLKYKWFEIFLIEVV